MKNEELHHSEELSRHFTARREEAPLISSTEVETLLDRHDMLPNTSRNQHTVRNTIMTLTGLATLGGIAYLAFFNAPLTHSGVTSTKATPAIKSNQQPINSNTIETTAQNKIVPQSAKPLRKTPERGPWSAGSDQFYADLSREQLKKLGIDFNFDTVIVYDKDDSGRVERLDLTAHSIGNGSPMPAADIPVPHFHPILMTSGGGHSAAFQIFENGRKKEWGMTADNKMMDELRTFFNKPGKPGLTVFGYATSSNSNPPCKGCPPVRSDTIKIMIGRDMPQPNPFPFGGPNIDGYSTAILDSVLTFARFCTGTAIAKPAITWPTSLSIKVDTVTGKDVIDQLDHALNDMGMRQVHDAMARLNDLIPVIVRKLPFTGAPRPEDFIFWYEPNDELFDALPQAQASVFRAHLAAPPHCLSTPNAVLTTAEITYCVTEPQEVQVLVRDLTGKTLLVLMQKAVAGDNVLQFSTQTLPSGMYVVTVHEIDGTERSRRIWVENAHPKNPKDISSQPDGPNSPDQVLYVNDDAPANEASLSTPMEHTALLSIPTLELNAQSLAKIGVESNDVLAAYYMGDTQPTLVNYLGVVRSWGAIIKTLDRSSVTNVTVPTFEPSVVTDGIGRKRIFAGDSNYDALVPVLLRSSTLSDSIGARDLIFWYQATPDFLASLPDSARMIAQDMIGHGGQASVHTAQGVIAKVIAYPNPSKGKLSVKLSMDAVRDVTISLKNLLGQEVAEPLRLRAQGVSEQKLDFSRLPDGIYLLDITSEIGERFVQRIVIEH